MMGARCSLIEDPRVSHSDVSIVLATELGLTFNMIL